MERKKASLSLKTAAKNRISKEVQLDGETPHAANDHKRRILRDVDCSVSNQFNVDIPCTQPVSYDKILEGIVAFIDVRSNTENRFEGISKQMEMLGAKVVKKFTAEVTHVIFKDGKKTTREKALKKGIHLVSVLWVESCRESGKRVCEDLFPVLEPGESATPLMVGRLKRTKSMQPNAFEEDVQNSAERGERRRKRKQAKNLTPSAMILCAETQDPYTCSPMVFKPMPQPHMVPDTPCHALDVSPYSTKTRNSDADSTEKKPIEPIKFSVAESDESPSSGDDIPSSIRKLKKRLLSKGTPTRPPSFTLTDPRTPTAQPTNTPKDELLTGSEQSKKRKRQDSTKNTHGEDIVQSVPKPRKKAKVEGQTECDSNMHARINERNDSVTSVNGVKDNETTDEQTNDTNTSRGKKKQAKQTKKLPEENANQNFEDIELDTAVCSSGASNLKKRFSKTAKLVAHVDQGDDFGDVNASRKKEEILFEKKAKTKLGILKKGQRLKQEKGDNEEKQVNQEGVVSQGKLVFQDKLVSRENLVSREKLKYHFKGCPEEEEGLTHCMDQDEGNEVRSSRDDTYTVKGDSETCTEEEEEKKHDEKENRTAKKQRTKLVKKVKPKQSIVMTSVHFNEQDIVLSVVRKLGGFFIEDRVSPSTSHVIAGSPRRTLNVLMAIAHGSWLVSPMWVMKSLEVGYWVDEEPYELSDAFPAAQLCRLERVSAGTGYQQELLVECPPIFVSENCSPPSDSLMTLISLCGGKVSSSVRKAGICIGSMTRRMQAVNITEQWLLDCITQHAVLPFTNYALNSPAKRRRETSPSY